MSKEIKTTKVKTKSAIIGRVAPHSIDAEVAVLGAMMLNKEVSAKVISLFSNDSIRRTQETRLTANTNIFYDLRHQAIYKGIVELFNKNIVPDIVTLTEHLRSIGTLEEAGGTFYISEINRLTPTYANYQVHCRIIQEYYFKRCLIETSNNILANCYDDTTDAIEVIDKAEADVFQIAEQRITKTYKDMLILSTETSEELLKQLSNQNINTVSTGYRDLDNKLNGGLNKSDLIILAARPSMGKSAFALALAYNTAGSGTPVGFFSLEMSARQLVIRLLNLHINRVKQIETVQSMIKNVNDATRNANQDVITTGLKELSVFPIYFDDTAAISIMELRAKCRQMKAEKNIGLIIVDYLQLIRSTKAETREREIAIIASTLKQIARELDVPVLALAQLNRVYESRVHDGKNINAQKTPILSDLRESGSIEQDADVVMFIHRPEALLKNDPEKEAKLAEHNWKNLAQIVVEKHRNGNTGIVNLKCFIEYSFFGKWEYDPGNIPQSGDHQRNNYQVPNNNLNSNNVVIPPNSVEDIPF
jgi:replicative DNA helicase